MSVSTEDIAGNRLKIIEPIEVRIGSWNSSETETWGPGTSRGTVTPPIYAVWTPKKNGTDAVYYQINEFPPFYFIKHNQSALDLLPDSGGAQYLDPQNQSSDESVLFSGFGSALDALNGKNIVRVIKIGALGVAAFIGFKLYRSLK